MYDNKKNISLIRDNILARGIHFHPTFGRYFYTGYGISVFSCELFYDTIMFQHFNNTSISLDTLKLYLKFQTEDGFIARAACTDPRVIEMNPCYRFECEEHAQPFLFQIALLISRAGGDISWLTIDIYNALKKYLEHWINYWDRDCNGLCEWNSAPHGCSDTAFERAGTWRSLFCEGVDLNCSLYMEFLAAEKIAAALGYVADQEFFLHQAELKKRMIQELLWDEEDGFFYDRDIRTGNLIKLKHGHCFHVLESGIATKEQAERIVKDHLKNTKEFWSRYPIPSYAMNEPYYTRHYIPKPGQDQLHYLTEGHANWQGGMWPHVSYSLAHGLKMYGYIEEAMYIADGFLELVNKDPGLYEWYDAESGEGKGEYPFYAGAEVLMAFLKAELESGYNPYFIGNVVDILDNTVIAQTLGINTITSYSR